MKKLLSLILALALVLSLGITAFAAEGDEQPAASNSQAVETIGTEAGKVKPAVISLFKEYELVGGTTTPSETISFTCTQTAPQNAQGDYNVPLTVSTATIEEHANATDAQRRAPFTLTFEKYYTKVGEYRYEIREDAPNPKTLGVEYSKDYIYVVVTITNEMTNTVDAEGHTVYATTDNLKATVSIHRVTTKPSEEGGTELVDEKIDPNPDPTKPESDYAFLNKYNMGTLKVTKEVSGNLASNKTPFTIYVTFKNATGDQVTKSKITYKIGEVEQESKLEMGTTPIELKNGDTAEFLNIPAGVTYEVKEDYSHATGKESPETQDETHGYTITYVDADNNKQENVTADAKISGAIEPEDKDQVFVQNKKETEPDTGIVLDSLPYVLVIGAVAAAMVVMIIRKRREVEG